jgi:NAD dependent epimerase/dehydratase family enzyme
MFSYRLASAWHMKTENNLFDQFVKTFNLNNNNAKSPSTKGSASSIKKIVITGATGLIGQELTKRFEQRDIEVVKVTSQKKLDGTPNVVVWDLNDSSVKNAELLNDADIVINMVGENVGEFWSEEKKQRITRSRMAGTALIVKKISELKKKPKLFISASGLSYYGYLKSEQVFDENDAVTDEPGEYWLHLNLLLYIYNHSYSSVHPHQNNHSYISFLHFILIGFLTKIALDWESEALRAEALGVRTVCVRFAPIFTTKAGILSKLMPIFGLGAGGVLGSGKQPFNWVSLVDTLDAIDFIIDNKSIKGPVNICSPVLIDNAVFTSAIGRLVKE